MKNIRTFVVLSAIALGISAAGGVLTDNYVKNTYGNITISSPVAQVDTAAYFESIVL